MVLCLVNPVIDRLLSLLNRVKYDVSLTSVSASWEVNSFSISENYLIYAVTVFTLIFFLNFVVRSYSLKIFHNYLVMQLQFFCRNLFCVSILWKGIVTESDRKKLAQSNTVS